MSRRGGAFIYLIGIAGTGKLTIAKAIRERYDCILVDNHLVNNAVFSLIDPDGVTPLAPEVWIQVARIRQAVLDTIRTLARPDRNFVFTNELLEGNPRHAKVFNEVLEVARAKGARLLPVRLLISPEEAAVVQSAQSALKR